MITDLAAADGVIYAGGVFRHPENAAGNKLLGHQMLVTIDASDTSAPRFVAEHDMLLTRVFAIVDGALVAVQDGFDETALDSDEPVPTQNLRVKTYPLADPFEAVPERTIEIPDTMGRTLSTKAAIGGSLLVLSIGTGAETPGETTLSWVIDLSAAVGAEIVGTMEVACRAPVKSGDLLWCFGAVGAGTGYARVFDLTGSGTLVAAFTVDLPTLVSPAAATLLGDGGVAVMDNQAGLLRLGFDAGVGIAVIDSATGFDGAGTDVLAPTADAGGLLAQSSAAIYRLDLSDLSETASLAMPGAGFRDYVRGTGLRSFGDAEGRITMAALGDFGVLLLESSSSGLSQLGGYYRHFGTNNFDDENLREGNY